MTLTDGSPMKGEPDFRISMAPHVAALAPMRREVAGRASTYGLASPVLDEVLVILSELCTNAIVATEPGNAPVLVRVWLAPSTVILEVENLGGPFDHDEALAQLGVGADTIRGRGLVIVRALADAVTTRFDDDRCIVRAVVSRG